VIIVSTIFIFINYIFVFASVRFFEAFVWYKKVIIAFDRREYYLGFTLSAIKRLRSGDSYVSPKRIAYVDVLIKRLKKESKSLP
jgi:hypothetical protein